jgi:hypothetical protein
MVVKSKYSRDDRQYIVDKVENLKNRKHYKKIFKILMSDPSISYSKSADNVYLDLAIINDATLDKVSKFLNTRELNIDYEYQVPSGLPDNVKNAYKRSNFDNNIIKQQNIKKIMNNSDDYEEFNISNNKKNLKKRY